MVRSSSVSRGSCVSDGSCTVGAVSRIGGAVRGRGLAGSGARGVGTGVGASSKSAGVSREITGCAWVTGSGSTVLVTCSGSGSPAGSFAVNRTTLPRVRDSGGIESPAISPEIWRAASASPRVSAPRSSSPGRVSAPSTAGRSTSTRGIRSTDAVGSWM